MPTSINGSMMHVQLVQRCWEAELSQPKAHACGPSIGAGARLLEGPAPVVGDWVAPSEEGVQQAVGRQRVRRWHVAAGKLGSRHQARPAALVMCPVGGISQPLPLSRQPLRCALRSSGPRSCI